MPEPTIRCVRTTDAAHLTTYIYEPANAAADLPTVVLAHGWTLTHAAWHRVVAGLLGSCRIVLWDQRGHGESTLTGGSHRSRGESVGRLGQDLREIVAATVPAGSPIILVGHSMGGMTVMAYAGQASPAELQRVCGVVLVSTAAGGLRGPGLPGEARIMRTLARLPFRGRPGRLISTKRQRAYVFGTDARDDDVALTRDLTGNVSLISYGAFYAALMQHDETAALGHLQNIPTTILVGDQDKLTPQVLATRLHEALPSAQLRILHGRGHMVLLEEPDAVVGAIKDKLPVVG